MKYLKLIRYQNLLLLAFMQLLFRYGFLKFQNIFLSLNDWQYALLVLATVLIAAAGYVINDILDQETDYDNDKGNVIVGKLISEKAAYNLYFVLNITGVGIGYYLANLINKPSFAGAFIIISATLYMYATSLKQMLLIGNIVVALILSFSVIIIGLFDLLPATSFALVNTDDKNGMIMLQNTLASKHTFALKTPADFKGKVIENEFTGLVIKINGKEVYSR